MTALDAESMAESMAGQPAGPGRHRRPDPVPGSEFDWPASPEMELWALRVRIDAACRKGEAREGWVSCRVLRRTLGDVG